MAQDPQQHAKDYGLTRDAAADVEAEEGPALGGQGGETRTNVPAHAESEGQGPKTRRKIRDIVRGKAPGGTH